jgi:tryptophan 7-halogenase
MITSICIVGGGTSGCISALMIKSAYPNMNVTLIESSQIGIIGVGEGSTEHWKKFMEHVGITVPELVREAGATFKIGIKFTNWHGDGTHYFHSLSEQYGNHSVKSGLPTTWMRMIAENWDPLDTAWGLSINSRHVEPLHDILAQYHFDTFKLNEFLHNKCREKNISIIDTEITDVKLDEQGNVIELIDTSLKSHKHDFYIDCSGFKRIIGSKLGAEWVNCQHQLPMNSALAFPTEYTEEIPSYTEATALSSGWAWRIPTQTRYGNGYVFCDNFIDETKAYDEVQKHYKEVLKIEKPIEIGRKIKFGAGYVKEFWLKNCVMIGLSGIFVEPLEASSIGTTIQQCFRLLPSLAFYNKNETVTASKYNQDMKIISENIIDFIQLHYITQRKDSKFWQWCKNEMVLTDFNKQYLDTFKESFPNIHYFNFPLQLFSYLNFAQVMHGLRLFNIEKIKKMYDTHFSHYTDASNRIIKENNEYCTKLETYSHREALNILKDRGLEVKYRF